MTGFAVGHSSFNILTARRDVVMHSFDLGFEALSMVAFLRKKFSNRLNIVVGNSTRNIPLYFANNPKLPPISCDMIVVDGGHEGDVPLRDICSFARASSKPYNVIIMDDMHMTDVRTAWEVAVRDGTVRELLNCKYVALGVVMQSKC